MQWVTDNWRTVGAILSAVSWVLWQTGPAIARKTKAMAASVWPKIKANSGVFNGSLLPVIAALAFLLFPVDNPPADPQRVPDIMDTCGASGRALLADALDAFAAESFKDDQSREDAINEKILDVIEASYAPLHDEIAKAIQANNVTACAEKIRQGELRHE